jgi:hypothetical protein
MENDGLVVEYTVQEEIEQVVREEMQYSFTLAASSPLCNGLLGEQLGYLADTEEAQSIFEALLSCLMVSVMRLYLFWRRLQGLLVL